MGYARQVYTQAENELNRRRTTAQDNAQRRLENFYAVCPEAEDVRRRIHSKSGGYGRFAQRQRARDHGSFKK